MHPIGPAPTTATTSPSPTPASSWAFRAQANGSATEASAKDTWSSIRFRPSTFRTSSGTTMYCASPPSQW